jgi:fatty-acyl-CoA synthase
MPLIATHSFLAQLVDPCRDLSALRLLPVGGSAVPLALSKQYKEVTGHHILQAWGMTETSPLGAVCQIQSKYVSQD